MGAPVAEAATAFVAQAKAMERYALRIGWRPRGKSVAKKQHLPGMSIILSAYPITICYKLLRVLQHFVCFQRVSASDDSLASISFRPIGRGAFILKRPKIL